MPHLNLGNNTSAEGAIRDGPPQCAVVRRPMADLGQRPRRVRGSWDHRAVSVAPSIPGIRSTDWHNWP